MNFLSSVAHGPASLSSVIASIARVASDITTLFAAGIDGVSAFGRSVASSFHHLHDGLLVDVIVSKSQLLTRHVRETVTNYVDMTQEQLEQVCEMLYAVEDALTSKLHTNHFMRSTFGWYFEKIIGNVREARVQLVVG